jgi:thioesterase domain-containing protein
VGARRRIGRYGLDRIEEYSGAVGRRMSLSNPVVATLKGALGLTALLARLVRQHLRLRFAHELGQAKARVLRYCLDRGRRPPAFARSLSVDQIYALAESSHVRVGTVEGEVLLLCATAGNGDFGDEPYKNLYFDALLGWGPRVRGQVRRIDVDGGHYSMFQAPHVQALARTLQPHIDAARQGARQVPA